MKHIAIIKKKLLWVFTSLSHPSEVPSENRKKNTETIALQKPISQAVTFPRFEFQVDQTFMR